MDLPLSRTPPRYVPTLTEVVDEMVVAGAVPTGAVPAGAVATVTTDVFVPAENAFEAGLQADHEAPVTAPAGPAPVFVPSAEDRAMAEEMLVQRLLERVEKVLDQRLRQTIAQVVQEQTRSVTLRLQEELESVVRQTVHEAVLQEMTPPSP